MATHPSGSGARERLLTAQRAESAALKKVESAERTYQRAALRASQTDGDLAKAQAVVVEVSGLERAARLLDVDLAVLRRRTRDRAASSAGEQP